MNPTADFGAEEGLDRNGGWKFLTNHAHVMLSIARNRQITMRVAATTVGITERATQAIVADLVEAGYLIRTRTGRRNVYTIPANRPLRHPLDTGAWRGRTPRHARTRGGAHSAQPKLGP